MNIILNAIGGDYILKDKLKDCRLAMRFSTKKVARKIGVDKLTYIHYKLGITYSDFDELIKLSKLFNVSMDYFLSK